MWKSSLPLGGFPIEVETIFGGLSQYMGGKHGGGRSLKKKGKYLVNTCTKPCRLKNAILLLVKEPPVAKININYE